MSLAIQVLLCFTLILLIQQGSCDVDKVFYFHQPTFVSVNGISTMPWIQRTGGASASRRADYTYPPGASSGYKVHTKAVLWPKARGICVEEGGHLAVLNSVAEANLVTEIFRNSERITGSQYPDFASIGFHSLFEPEVEFVTIYDETLQKAGYNQWMKYRPGLNGKRLYGSLHITGGLNNHSTDTLLGFICELPISQH